MYAIDTCLLVTCVSIEVPADEEPELMEASELADETI
jgi:hypothetical protein